MLIRKEECNSVGDHNSQISYIISLKDVRVRKCSLYWKSRKAKKVAKFILDAEALGLRKTAENGTYLRKFGELITEKKKKRMKLVKHSKTLNNTLRSTSGTLSSRMIIYI